jgi:hypothetical protein
VAVGMDVLERRADRPHREDHGQRQRQAPAHHGILTAAGAGQRAAAVPSLTACAVITPF